MEELKESHRLCGLAAGRNSARLADQIREWEPDGVAVSDPAAAKEIDGLFPNREFALRQGPDAAASMVEALEADVVLSGITGAAGLGSSLATIRGGKDLALANKESMVLAGPVLEREAERHGARIIPVDSEHSAIFQCLQGHPASAVRRVFLTASGGPFRESTAQELEQVTPEQALKHPTWNMGAKITVDSATLMNKALEVIEARWLFHLDPDQIQVVVHPQSIVHSMVEFQDGSILAQMGVPDMAVPIRYALSYPGRSSTRDDYFDLTRFRTLTFEEPDLDRFPGLGLGFEAARRGGTAGAVVNAANEVAVDLFLKGKLPFVRIPQLVKSTLEQVPHVDDPTIEEILLADRTAREEALACRC